ncbi:MAG: hypothetical protein ABH845_04225 [Candidatus Omnitrophota bacterium]
MFIKVLSRKNLFKRFLLCGGLLFWMLLIEARGGSAEDERLEAAIHLDTAFSYGGVMSPEAVTRLAEERGMNAVVFGDHALVKVTYGIPPFRNVLRISFQEPSVFRVGLKRYLQEIEKVQNHFPTVLVIPGLEVTPFYYWQGFPPFGATVRDLNKHMIVFGLENEEDFRKIPLLGNGSSFYRPFHLKDIWRFWGFLGILLGFFLMHKRVMEYRDEKGTPLAPVSAAWRRIGIVSIVVGVCALWDQFPFREPIADPYSGKPEAAPYQAVIDYANRHGALIFWVHPEAKPIERRRGPVTFVTDPYPDMLLKTHHYTGFSVFYEGYRVVAQPGDVWDQVLLEYCRGRRNRPVWAIGELDYTEEGRADAWMGNVKTILLVESKNREALLEAMRRGRMYAVRRSRDAEIRLDHFEMVGGEGKALARMGEEAMVSESAGLRIALSEAGRTSQTVHFRLIRDGEIIQEKTTELPYEDVSPVGAPTHARSYYRILVEGSQGNILVSNPIFVTGAK